MKSSIIINLLLLWNLLPSSHSVSGRPISQLNDTASMVVSEGWNMISLPLDVPDARVSVLFPNATSKAFSYNHSYLRHDTLEMNQGYWIRLASAETISVV